MSWLDGALCAEVGGDLFFPEEPVSQHNYAAARRICGACPVRVQCLQFALDEHIGEGMFGGLTPHERRKMSGTGESSSGQRVAELARAGLTPAGIAAVLGVTERHVYRLSSASRAGRRELR